MTHQKSYFLGANVQIYSQNLLYNSTARFWENHLDWFFNPKIMSYNKNKPDKGKEDVDDPIETIGKAVGALAGVAFAAWGAYKLFTGSESESSSRKEEAHALPIGYSQGSFKPSGSTARPFIPSVGSDQWCYPAKDWVKVNTDASLKENNSSVAIGGVIRDHKGVWKIGFAGRIPSCSIPQAELWAIRVGLKTAWEKGFRKIEIETDSAAALWLLNNGKVSKDLERGLVDDCLNLIGRDWIVEKKQCPGKFNKVADIMADLGHGPNFEISYNENEKIEYYSTPPPVVHFHYKRELLE